MCARARVCISHEAREAGRWGSKRFPRYLSHSTLYTMSRLLLKPRRPSRLGARTPGPLLRRENQKCTKDLSVLQMHFSTLCRSASWPWRESGKAPGKTAISSFDTCFPLSERRHPPPRSANSFSGKSPRSKLRVLDYCIAEKYLSGNLNLYNVFICVYHL